MKITRRDFIAGGLVATGLAGFAGYSGLFSQKAIAGEIQGASSAIGHQLAHEMFTLPPVFLFIMLACKWPFPKSWSVYHSQFFRKSSMF
jgi:hypothetical protein